MRVSLIWFSEGVKGVWFVSRFKVGITPSVGHTFAGHQTFALRSGWLKKGYDALVHEGMDIFSRDEALVVLGVGKNMVTSIRHWLLVTGLVEETKEGKRMGLQPTSLAHLLLADEGFDPYLEHTASLWLLHTLLCSPRSSAFTWQYAFYRWRRPEILREKLVEAIYDVSSVLPRSPSRETISRDVDCFVHTYAGTRSASEDSLDSPLTALRLIVPDYDGRQFRFATGSKPHLSPAVFAWALGTFWNDFFPSTETLAATEVIYGEGTPGSLFKLDEDSAFVYLSALEDVTRGMIRFDDSSQTQSLVRTVSQLDMDSLLEACYVRQ